jgi:hypothetical protein
MNPSQENASHLSNPALAYVAMASPGLIVIDREEARVFRALAPGTEPVRVLTEPLPRGSAIPFGPRTPPPSEFFETIAQAIDDIGVLQIYGNGPDSGTEVNALLAWLETNKPELAAHVAVTQIIPERFWSDSRMLTQARNRLASQVHALSTG